MQSIINKQRPPGNLPAGAAVFRGTLFFLPYFAASTSSAGGVENALAIRFEQSEMTKKLSS